MLFSLILQDKRLLSLKRAKIGDIKMSVSDEPRMAIGFVVNKSVHNDTDGSDIMGIITQSAANRRNTMPKSRIIADTCCAAVATSLPAFAKLDVLLPQRNHLPKCRY